MLITNPKLVETGVNLHEHGYSTIIFYEIEYSLYVLWQSMSRVWRPGQTRKVKIFFSHYTGTLEEKALSRMGRKMMAGQLLYGEDVTSALVEDTGDASLVIDLIHAIQDEEDLVIRPDTQILRINTIRSVQPAQCGVTSAQQKARSNSGLFSLLHVNNIRATIRI